MNKIKKLYVRMVLFFIGSAIRREIQEYQTRKGRESAAAAVDLRAFGDEFGQFVDARIAAGVKKREEERNRESQLLWDAAEKMYASSNVARSIRNRSPKL